MKQRRSVRVILMAIALFVAAMAPSAANAASKKAIQEKDFVITVGKTSINLLTDDPLALEKKLGKSFSRQSISEEPPIYPLETAAATFYTWTSDLKEASFITSATLKKKAKTARGIQIGSTKKALLNAYPSPIDSYENDKDHTIYVFGQSMKPEYWDELESGKHTDKRPLYFYVLRIEVNKKSGRVTSIFYDNQVAG